MTTDTPRTSSEKALTFDPDVRVLRRCDSNNSLTGDGAGDCAEAAGSASSSSSRGAARDRWLCGRDEAEIKFDVSELVDAARGGYISYDEEEAGVGQYHGGEATLRGIEHLVDEEGTARRANQRKSALEAVLTEQQKQKEEDESGRNSRHGRRRWEAIARACEEKTEAARVEAARLGERDARAAEAIRRLWGNEHVRPEANSSSHSRSYLTDSNHSRDGLKTSGSSKHRSALAKKFLGKSRKEKEEERENARARARARSAHSRIERNGSMPNLRELVVNKGKSAREREREKYQTNRGSSHLRFGGVGAGAGVGATRKTSSAHSRIRPSNCPEGLVVDAAAAEENDVDGGGHRKGNKGSKGFQLLKKKLGKSPIKRKAGRGKKGAGQESIHDDDSSLASGISDGIMTMAPDFTS